MAYISRQDYMDRWKYLVEEYEALQQNYYNMEEYAIEMENKAFTGEEVNFHTYIVDYQDLIEEELFYEGKTDKEIKCIIDILRSLDI